MKIGDIVEVVKNWRIDIGTKGVVTDKTDYCFVVCFKDTKYNGQLHDGTGFDNTYSSWYFENKEIRLYVPQREANLSLRDSLVLYELKSCKGYDERVNMKDLAEDLSMNARDIRESVELLTNMGYPIGNVNGYFWITTQDELNKVIEHQKARALSSIKRYNKVKKIRLEDGFIKEE